MLMDTAASPLTDDALQLLAEARAAFAAFLNLHFMHLPDEFFVDCLRQPATQEFLQGLRHAVEVPAETAEGARLMLGFLRANAGLSAAELAQVLGVDRTRLYRGVSPTYGPPPPYETVWTASAEVPTRRLQQLAAQYRQADLALAEDSHERPDYIGLELAYVESLARCEAACLEANDAAGAAAWRERQRTFLVEHLAAWAPGFITKALEHARTDFYRGHLLMLGGFLREQTSLLAEMEGVAVVR